VEVRYTVKPGQRDEFCRRVNEAGVIEATRREAGNLRYEYFYPVASADEIYLAELWESAEALRLHSASEHFQRLAEIKASYVENARIEKHYIAALQD